MSKVNCPCGNQISDVISPNNYTGIVITSKTLDSYYELEETPCGKNLMAETIHGDGLEMWECPECGRIAISVKRNSSEIKWYIPEDEKAIHILNQ